MQVREKGKKRVSAGIGGASSLPFSTPFTASHAAYQHAVSFYLTPPDQQITLEEFESFAIDRLKVLKEIDSLKIRGVKGESFDSQLQQVLRKYLHLPHNNNEGALEEAIRKDVISHFTLRLMYCRPSERQWFLTQERELLKFRLKKLEGALEGFIAANNLDFPKLDDIEFQELHHFLEQTNRSAGRNERTENVFYKVPFEQALDLVQHRKVFLRKGFAYVHKSGLIHLVLNDYRRHLSLQLARAFRSLPAVQRDIRIAGLLESLPKQYLGREYVPGEKEGVEIDLAKLDDLMAQSFPLCMERLHLALRFENDWGRRDHHLKHGGRMQYGLFLKGIGLTLEQSLAFWKEELIQASRNFEKDYAYNIRHSYGMVGKRTSYTPYACDKIINMAPGPGDFHGCPYKFSDKGSGLKADLLRKGVNGQTINEVLRFSNDGHYQEACRTVFEALHVGAEPHAQTHPNKYFDRSIKYYKEKAEFEANGGQLKPQKEHPTTTVIV